MKEKTLTRLLWFFLAINIIYLFASIFISRRAMGDDLEHIHASWLVWQGYIPYTDFFEHHHPLTWYIFAPLVGFFIPAGISSPLAVSLWNWFSTDLAPTATYDRTSER